LNRSAIRTYFTNMNSKSVKLSHQQHSALRLPNGHAAVSTQK
jgi:hypothetical protein